MIGLIDDALAEKKRMENEFPDSKWTLEATKLIDKFRLTKVAD